MLKFILETRNLTKIYGKQVVVDNLSLKVPQGCIYGLLGPNGAGKSTTLKLLTGVARPSHGEILVFGEPWRREALRYIGALIETPALYGNLTAWENLQIHTTMLDLDDQEIRRVLKIVGLEDTGGKLVSRFSLGMKQRLGIAIALLGNPRLLILDEPMNGLDPLGMQKLRELIKNLAHQGITVLISSHILGEITQVADYVGIIHEGKLKFQGKLLPGEDLEKLFLDVVRGEENA